MLAPPDMLVGQVCEHRSRIWNNIVGAPLVSHFQEKAHKCDDFKFVILEKIRHHLYKKIDSKRLVLQRESYWIYH